MQQAVEDVLAVGLQAQADALAQPVGLDDGLCRGQGHGVDVRAEEAPAVVAVAQQRVDAVGPHADSQGTHLGAAGNLTVVVIGEQVGDDVDVVGAAGNRRAQVVGGNVPVLDAVLGLQQGTVEHPHGLGVGEVDAGFAVGVGDGEARQLRVGLDQAGEVVAALVAVARVQGGFVRGHGSVQPYTSGG
ncbi:hypothetical protein D3C75_981980 [compost metagenome]